MTFIHHSLPRLSLTSEDLPNGRIYKTSEGLSFPSVTTVLSRMIPHPELDKWIERVGKDEANKVCTQASRRGTVIHSICEKYLLNEKNVLKGIMPVNVESFKKIQPILDKNVKLIYGVELPLFSKYLNTAGRCDLFCKWNNDNAIIDFKTSRRIKNEEDILSYFLQSACYAFMASVIYKIKIEKIVIIIAVDHEDVLVFEKPVHDYINPMIKLFLDHKNG